MEEKQLFLQRNQELLEKVQFTFDYTFINIYAVCIVHCQVFEPQSRVDVDFSAKELAELLF